MAKEAKTFNYTLRWVGGLYSAIQELDWRNGTAGPRPVPRTELKWIDLPLAVRQWFDQKFNALKASKGNTTRKFYVDLGWRSEDGGKHIGHLTYCWDEAGACDKYQEDMKYEDLDSDLKSDFDGSFANAKTTAGI